MAGGFLDDHSHLRSLQELRLGSHFTDHVKHSEGEWNRAGLGFYRQELLVLSLSLNSS